MRILSELKKNVDQQKIFPKKTTIDFTVKCELPARVSTSDLKSFTTLGIDTSFWPTIGRIESPGPYELEFEFEQDEIKKATQFLKILSHYLHDQDIAKHDFQLLLLNLSLIHI